MERNTQRNNKCWVILTKFFTAIYFTDKQACGKKASQRIGHLPIEAQFHIRVYKGYKSGFRVNRSSVTLLNGKTFNGRRLLKAVS